jgi:hypothetical protein
MHFGRYLSPPLIVSAAVIVLMPALRETFTIRQHFLIVLHQLKNLNQIALSFQQKTVV